MMLCSLNEHAVSFHNVRRYILYKPYVPNFVITSLNQSDDISEIIPMEIGVVYASLSVYSLITDQSIRWIR